MEIEIKGVKKAVDEFNNWAGKAIIFLNVNTKEVFTKAYTDKDKTGENYVKSEYIRQAGKATVVLKHKGFNKEEGNKTSTTVKQLSESAVTALSGVRKRFIRIAEFMPNDDRRELFPITIYMNYLTLEVKLSNDDNEEYAYNASPQSIEEVFEIASKWQYWKTFKWLAEYDEEAGEIRSK